MKPHYSTLAASILCAVASLASADTILGTDLHSINSAIPEINALLSANRGTNGGGDQSLQFGDQLQGTEQDDIIIGGLGIDILFGGKGNDVLVGGTEDFNPFNRDRAFGQEGDDVFLWAPGDGNDFFDGGEGVDTLIITLIGEQQDANGNSYGAPFFGVTAPPNPGSQNFDGIFIDSDTGLPAINVGATPGFCELLDSTVPGMDELNLDFLVHFRLRGVADNFEQQLATDPNIDPATLDTGGRISVHLINAEFVVCASRDGSTVDVFDLRQTPAVKASVSDLPANAYRMVTSF